MRKSIILVGVSLLLCLTACTEESETNRKQNEKEESSSSPNREIVTNTEEVDPFRDLKNNLYGFWGAEDSFLILGNHDGDIFLQRFTPDSKGHDGVKKTELGQFFIFKKADEKNKYTAKFYPPSSQEFDLTVRGDNKQIIIKLPNERPTTYFYTELPPEQYFLK